MKDSNDSLMQWFVATYCDFKFVFKVYFPIFLQNNFKYQYSTFLNINTLFMHLWLQVNSIYVLH